MFAVQPAGAGIAVAAPVGQVQVYRAQGKDLFQLQLWADPEHGIVVAQQHRPTVIRAERIHVAICQGRQWYEAAGLAIDHPTFGAHPQPAGAVAGNTADQIALHGRGIAAVVDDKALAVKTHQAGDRAGPQQAILVDGQLIAAGEGKAVIHVPAVVGQLLERWQGLLRAGRQCHQALQNQGQPEQQWPAGPGTAATAFEHRIPKRRAGGLEGTVAQAMSAPP